MRLAAVAVIVASSAAACTLTTSLDGYTCCDDDAAAADSSLPGSEASTPDTDVPPQPDSDGLGDGHMGDKHVVAQESVNTYAALAGDAAAGATTIDVESTDALAAGDLLLVWQTMTDAAAPEDAPLGLTSFAVGTYELVRAKSADSNVARTELGLATPLAHSYTTPGAQIVHVAEYTNLTIDKGATLLAPAWSGKTGGIVAVLVRGGVKVDGAVSVDALGGRGGITAVNSGGFNCTTADGNVPDGYAARGEGLVTTVYATPDPTSLPGGRANQTTGGGGGICHNSGAGGGGNGGAGGVGGRDYDSNGVGRDVGGLGGVAVQFLAKDRLVLGGGGGAGDRHQDLDTTGARGGGVVLLRAHDLTATGSIRANGATPTVITNHDGVGGGGAGGTMAITILGAATCSAPIAARGGNGGSTTMSNVGPGGGGGGGHVWMAAPPGCAIDVSSGVAGTQANPGAALGKPYGAKPDNPIAGVIETL